MTNEITGNSIKRLLMSWNFEIMKTVLLNVRDLRSSGISNHSGQSFDLPDLPGQLLTLINKV